MTDLKLVPNPNPTKLAVDRMETILREALTGIRYERRNALDRDDREAHRIANNVQQELEDALSRLRSEK